MAQSLRILPLLMLALAAAPDANAAVYKWRDASGRIVYSDLPPPASVAPSAVLQAPGRPSPAKGGAQGDAAPAAAPAGPSAEGARKRPAAKDEAEATREGKEADAGPKSMADRELEFRKRRQERLDAEAKSLEAQARARQQARACEDARNNLRTLESGIRVSRMNAQGEVEVLDDRERESRMQNARRDLQEVCKTGNGG